VRIPQCFTRDIFVHFSQKELQLFAIACLLVVLVSVGITEIESLAAKIASNTCDTLWR